MKSSNRRPKHHSPLPQPGQVASVQPRIRRAEFGLIIYHPGWPAGQDLLGAHVPAFAGFCRGEGQKLREMGRAREAALVEQFGAACLEAWFDR